MPIDFASFKPENLDLHVLSGETMQRTALSADAKQALHASLRDTLNAELAKQGDTLGLKPGDTVAISSSVGQSVTF